MASLTSKDMFENTLGTGKRSMHVFISVDCSYCRKLEPELEQLNGYMPHKPMAGYVGKDSVTGEPVIFYTAGHTRMDSIALANSELPAPKFPDAKKITHVTMVVHPAKTTTTTKLNAWPITENEAAPDNPYEQSIVVKRMLNDGASIEEITAETSFSTGWVNSLLALADVPLELQRMVVDDVIKSTFAIETIKAHGDKALAVLQAALARKIGATTPSADAPQGRRRRSWRRQRGRRRQ